MGRKKSEGKDESEDADEKIEEIGALEERKDESAVAVPEKDKLSEDEVASSKGPIENVAAESKPEAKAKEIDDGDSSGDEGGADPLVEPPVLEKEEDPEVEPDGGKSEKESEPELPALSESIEASPQVAPETDNTPEFLKKASPGAAIETESSDEKEEEDEDKPDFLKAALAPALVPANKKRENRKKEKPEDETDQDVAQDDKPDFLAEDVEEDFVSAGAEIDPWFSDDEPKPKEGNRPKAVKKKTGCWTIFATLFFFATLLAVVAVVGIGIFAWSKKDSFAGDFQKDLMAKLESRGLFLSYGEWNYEFPRGLVFSELTLFETDAREKPRFKLSNVGISTDVVTLAKEQGRGPLSAQIDLAGSTASFFEKGEAVAELPHLTGILHVDEGSIRMNPLRTKLGEMELELVGTVMMPNAGEETGTPAADSQIEEGVAAVEGNASPLAGFDPAILETLKEWFNVTASGAAPRLQVDLFLDMAAPEQMKVSGRLDGKDFTWSGVSLESAAIPFNFNLEGESLTLPGFFVRTGGGIINGDVVIDGTSEQIQIATLESTADVFGLLASLAPEMASSLGTLEFRDNPRILLKGSVPISTPADSSLEIDYGHWNGFDIVAGEKKIPVSNISGKLTLEARKLQTKDFQIRVFEGDSLVNGSVEFKPEGFFLDGMIEVDRMPLAEVAKFYGIDERLMTGDLSMNFRGSRGKEISTMKGNGDLKIENARLNGFPVVGPIQMFTGEIVPAFSRQIRSAMLGSFIIESGVLISSDINARSDQTQIVAGAQINFADKAVEFQSKAYVEGELATRSGLIDKGIEVKGAGTLLAPEMEIMSIPLELAEEAMQTSLGMTPASVKLITDFLGVPGESPSPPEGEGEEEAEDSEEEAGEASAAPAPEASLPTLGAPVISDSQ